MREIAAKSLRQLIDSGLALVIALTLGLAIPLTLHVSGIGSAQRATLLVVSAVGMALFCWRRSGSLGAVLASLIYASSPALILDMPKAPGAFPALLALALFPFLLWRLDALRDRPAARNFLLAGTAQAALLIMQMPLAPLLTAIALGWVSFETFLQAFNREASQMRAMPGLLALLAIALGAGVSGPAWIGITSETRAAYGNEAALHEEGSQVMRLEVLLAPPMLADEESTVGQGEAGSLGLASWTLALAGGIAALLLYTIGYRTRHPQAFLGAAYFALLALALLALVSTDVLSGWRILSDLPRAALLGPLAASLAILTSMNGFWLGKLESRVQVCLIAAICALPIAMAISYVNALDWRISGFEAALTTEAAASLIPTNDVAVLASGLSALLICAIAWRIRKPALTPRPYWHVPQLSRSEVAGLLAGAVIGFVIAFV